MLRVLRLGAVHEDRPFSPAEQRSLCIQNACAGAPRPDIDRADESANQGALLSLQAELQQLARL
jgi:hypothetical protein